MWLLQNLVLVTLAGADRSPPRRRKAEAPPHPRQERDGRSTPPRTVAATA